MTSTGLGRAVRFDRRRTGSTNKFDLKAGGTPKVSATFSLQMTGGKSGEPAVLGIALATKTLDLGPFGPFLLDPATMVLVFLKLGAQGKGTVQATVPAVLAGVTLYAQAANTELSNAIIVRLAARTSQLIFMLLYEVKLLQPFFVYGKDRESSRPGRYRRASTWPGAVATGRR